MILGYVRGTPLLKMRKLLRLSADDGQLCSTDDSRLRNLYGQLADVFIQLRRFEFPAIGRFAPSPGGGELGLEVSRPPISNCINMQVIEGLRPLDIMDEYGRGDGVMTSANDHVSMMLRIAWDAYKRGKSLASNHDEAGCDIFNLDMFSTFVRESWLDPGLDRGPYVLDHGDLGLYNILVDEDTLDIVAVLDWEWSRAVPRQFFTPPYWLTGLPLNMISMTSIYKKHVKKLDVFRSILAERERSFYPDGSTPLSDEWARIHEGGGVLIGPALESWTFIDEVAENYIYYHLGGYHKDRPARIAGLLASRPDYRVDADNKVRDTLVYLAQLREMGVISDDTSDQ